MVQLPKSYITLLCLILLYIFWGTEFFVIKLTIRYIPPFMLAAFTALTGGCVLFIFTVINGTMRPKLRDLKLTIAAGFLFVFASAGLIPITTVYLDSGLVALLSGLSPILSVTIERLIIKKGVHNRITLIGILIGFLGLFFTVLPAIGKDASISLTGVILGIISGVVWSIGMIVTRYADFSISVLPRNSLQLLFGGALLLLTSFLTGEWDSFNISGIPSHIAANLLYLVTCTSLIGYTAYLWLLNNSSIAIASSTAYVCPLIAVIVGITIGGERFSVYIMAAVLCIIASLILIANGRSKS